MEQHGLVVGLKGLGELLGGKSIATIRTALYRRPDTLPPPVRLEGTRTGPLWVVEDVVTWLRARTLKVGESYRGKTDRAATARAAIRRGRPTQEEQIEAAKLGLTVPELRKQQREQS